MTNDKQYINGLWVPSDSGRVITVENPATLSEVGTIAAGNAVDVDRAVAAATRAGQEFAHTTVAQRRDWLEKILVEYEKRKQQIAELVIAEVGCPRTVSEGAQVRNGVNHLRNAIDVLDSFEFETVEGSTITYHEPIGVVGMITPWNWPIHQIMSKVAYAIAAGCTMVLKPSVVAPLNAILLAEAIDASGLPAGVFNLVNGSGRIVGGALAEHPGVRMISLTGSTQAGGSVAAGAAATIKRVTQELGGKSPNVVLDGPHFEEHVAAGVRSAFGNTGQSCTAPSRMLVPAWRMAEAEQAARRAAEATIVGDPSLASTELGPLVNQEQFDRVTSYIMLGLEEGARLIVGGPGRPDGFDIGWYCRPTVFGDVKPDMRIAEEEIFGPVLCILGYDNEDQAVEMANDTEYGLAAYVSGDDLTHARALGARLSAGQVRINFCQESAAAFGGIRRSGNGREMGPEGLKEYLELKVVIG